MALLQTFQTYIQYFLFFVYIETWILYRDKEEGVSKIVQKAYEHYEDIEFLKSVDLNDPRRHIKLIAVSDEAEEEVSSNSL